MYDIQPLYSSHDLWVYIALLSPYKLEESEPTYVTQKMRNTF